MGGEIAMTAEVADCVVVVVVVGPVPTPAP